ncbi:hypothetical protein IID24_03920 [Patescibacteria group bacterium]|nr:hypothetical protein [Patescibacteria group bacterium]
MATIISVIILFASFIGGLVIIWRKFPLLVELSQGQEVTGVRDFVVRSTKRLRDSENIRAVPEKVLQKTLSKTRVLAMKTESKTGEWLSQLRKRSKEKKEKFSKEYWDQFKKRRGG